MRQRIDRLWPSTANAASKTWATRKFDFKFQVSNFFRGFWDLRFREKAQLHFLLLFWREIVGAREWERTRNWFTVATFSLFLLFFRFLLFSKEKRGGGGFRILWEAFEVESCEKFVNYRKNKNSFLPPKSQPRSCLRQPLFFFCRCRLCSSFDVIINNGIFCIS